MSSAILGMMAFSQSLLLTFFHNSIINLTNQSQCNDAYGSICPCYLCGFCEDGIEHVFVFCYIVQICKGIVGKVIGIMHNISPPFTHLWLAHTHQLLVKYELMLMYTITKITGELRRSRLSTASGRISYNCPITVRNIMQRWFDLLPFNIRPPEHVRRLAGITPQLNIPHHACAI